MFPLVYIRRPVSQRELYRKLSRDPRRTETQPFQLMYQVHAVWPFLLAMRIVHRAVQPAKQENRGELIAASSNGRVARGPSAYRTCAQILGRAHSSKDRQRCRKRARPAA